MKKIISFLKRFFKLIFGKEIIEKNNKPMLGTTYQNGYSFILGATVGYQFKLSENCNMDLFASAGTMQSYYRGYHKTLGVRYDDDGRNWDQSGEFLPYRGGIMISYKLR